MPPETKVRNNIIYIYIAIDKHHRAQLVMENAVLATYKATMAIAEAARVSELADAATAHFHG